MDKEVTVKASVVVLAMLETALVAMNAQRAAENEAHEKMNEKVAPLGGVAVEVLPVLTLDEVAAHALRLGVAGMVATVARNHGARGRGCGCGDFGMALDVPADVIGRPPRY